MIEQNSGFAWEDEDSYWRKNYSNRPYATAGRAYEEYQPGYRFGYEAANRHQDREWSDVEPELRRNWNTYDSRGNSTWEQMKEAVRDAWDRVTGRRHVSAR